jgi:hypothetical protein
MILTNKDYTNIKSLIKFAVNFDRGKLRWNELHFALGVTKKEFVYGVNEYTPKNSFNKIHRYSTPHAESAVITQMEYTNSLYVIRLNPELKFMLSKPCLECSNLIDKNRVKFLIYSIENGLKKVKL